MSANNARAVSTGTFPFAPNFIDVFFKEPTFAASSLSKTSY